MGMREGDKGMGSKVDNYIGCIMKMVKKNHACRIDKESRITKRWIYKHVGL